MLGEPFALEYEGQKNVAGRALWDADALALDVRRGLDTGLADQVVAIGVVGAFGASELV